MCVVSYRIFDYVNIQQESKLKCYAIPISEQTNIFPKQTSICLDQINSMRNLVVQVQMRTEYSISAAFSVALTFFLLGKQPAFTVHYTFDPHKDLYKYGSFPVTHFWSSVSC